MRKIYAPTTSPISCKKAHGRLGLLPIGFVLIVVIAMLLASFLLKNVPISEPLLYIAHAQEVEATSTPEVKLDTKDKIRDYVLNEAKKAGVHVAKIDWMIEHESHYDPKRVGDEDIVCFNKRSPFYKKPTHARGIWQITRCWHPEVSDAQAEDVKWSTDWALAIIMHSKNDCRSQWSTCDAWYDRG